MSEVAGLFVGIGGMSILLAGTYFLYQMARHIKYGSDYEARITALEIAMLDKVAKGKGIDLRKEIEKERFFQKQHSFRSRIRKEMCEEMFGKDKEENKEGK